MKIAITGHTAGIGQALAKLYGQQGHQIVGLSRREGNNIRNIPKIANASKIFAKGPAAYIDNCFIALSVFIFFSSNFPATQITVSPAV